MVIFENDGSQNTGMNDSVGLIIGDINNAYIIIADSCVLNNYDTAVKAGFNGGAYGEAKLIGFHPSPSSLLRNHLHNRPC